MALIKTALELALERTREVEADPSLVEAHEAKQSGKKSVGDFLDILPEEDSADTAMAAAQTRFIKDLPPPVDKSPRSRAFREGALEALLAQIKLPEIEADLSRLMRVGEGLSLVLDSSEFDAFFAQLAQAFSRYLSELSQYEELIRKQYAPKLRQKEEEIARRTGRAISLDPMQDPEFVQFRSQNLAALGERYEAAVEQLRAKARELFAS